MKLGQNDLSYDSIILLESWANLAEILHFLLFVLHVWGCVIYSGQSLSLKFPNCNHTNVREIVQFYVNERGFRLSNCRASKLGEVIIEGQIHCIHKNCHTFAINQPQ